MTLNPVAHEPHRHVALPLIDLTGVPLISWAKGAGEPNQLRTARRHPGVDGGRLESAAGIRRGAMARQHGLTGRHESVHTLHEFMQAVLPLLLQINVLLALFNDPDAAARRRGAVVAAAPREAVPAFR